MRFDSTAMNAFDENESRKNLHTKLLSFGVKFLDDAMLGILPNDLVLVGASSGAGKTQFCCNMALANVTLGKTVHYIALEADRFEIDRRIKFQILSKHFFADMARPDLEHGLQFDRWMLGLYDDKLAKYEEQASHEIFTKYKGLFLGYKTDKFNLFDLIESVVANADRTDLIIVDHVHYFDFEEEENEQKAIREIAKTARTLALEQGKPIVLVAHLRKKDRFNQELVPSIEEFHGSSELYKIATKAVTFSPGSVSEKGNFETFFRIGKNRLNGGVTRYLGRTMFSPQKGTYEEAYRVGWADQKKREPDAVNPGIFTELEPSLWPRWVDRQGAPSSHSYHDVKKLPNYADAIPRSTKPYADS